MELKKRKLLWESMKEHGIEKSGTSGPTLTGRGHVAFASDTASATGMTKRHINRYMKVLEALGDDMELLEPCGNRRRIRGQFAIDNALIQVWPVALEPELGVVG